MGEIELSSGKNLKTLQADPSAFRQALQIDANGQPVRFGECLDDWQNADFAAIDSGWQNVAGQTKQPATQRAYLERPRGHSKTSDLAVMSAWVLFASKRRLSGYGAAADRDQAKLLRDAIETIIRFNPWLSQILECQQWKIINKRTGSTLEIISSDAPTSYGLNPDFIIADEIVHWQKRDLWDSLISSAAKREHCMVVVISNAGFTESWQWEVREAIRQDESWYFSRIDGPVASWITQNNLDEQKRLLPHIAYDRLWLNQWAAGSGDALANDDIEAAVTLSGPISEAEPGWVYVAGVDLGLSRDASAVVIVGKHIGHYISHTKKPKLSDTQQAMIDAGLWEDPIEDELIEKIEEPTGRLKLASVRLWKPEGGRVSIEGIEKTLLRLNEKFSLSCIGFDPWQAAMLRERIQKSGIETEDVTFTGNNLTSMCSAVLESFNEGMIDLFPHAQLLSDLRNLRVVEKSYGVRLDSPRTLSGHGDCATALAISLHLLKNLGTGLVNVRSDYKLITS